MARWLKKFMDPNTKCPQCFGAMKVSDLRASRFNVCCSLSGNTNASRSFKQMAMVRCGSEFYNKSIIIGNLEREYDAFMEIMQQFTTEITILTIVISYLKRQMTKFKSKNNQPNGDKTPSDRNDH